jgi:D-alanyl-D-alanine carboxypeptidase
MKEYLKYIKIFFWITIPITVGIFGASMIWQGGHLAYRYAKDYVLAPNVSVASEHIDTNVPTEFESAPAPEPFTVTLGNISDKEFTPPAIGKMIRANLKTMELYMYEDGVLKDTLPIVGKGKTGSYWETPGGEYKVNFKEDNHFSSTGKVWMPYSLQFFGNYFIHGWPYYPNGKETPAGFSGGCIRLKTEDAKKVFDWADNKTLISIYSDSKKIPKELGNDSLYFSKNPDAKLNVSAKAYLVGDIDTGEIILEKNKDSVYPIASVSKLTTALTALDVVNQQNMASVSKKALDTYGNNGHFHVGEKIKVSDLVYPLLLESSNDAAEILAEQIGRDFFLRNMNQKAKAIGLTNTFFDDPSGLSPKNVSTPIDLFRLARYINIYKSFVYSVTKLPAVARPGHEWHNISQFYKNPQYIGGKSGFTDQAGETQVALFSIPVSEFDTRTLAVIVLESQDRLKDIQSILSYLKQNIYFSQNPLKTEDLINVPSTGTEDAAALNVPQQTAIVSQAQ